MKQLAKMTGLQRRQIANLARKGDIEGATRRDGYHFEYPVTPELLDWIDEKRRRVAQRKQLKSSAKSPKESGGFLNVYGLRRNFEIWFSRVGRAEGVLKMRPDEIQDVVDEIRPIALLYQRLTQSLQRPNLD